MEGRVSIPVYWDAVGLVLLGGDSSGGPLCGADIRWQCWLPVNPV